MVDKKGMELSIENIKLVLKPIGKSDDEYNVTMHKVDELDDSLLFRFSASHRSGRPIPVHWDGEMEIDFVK